MALTDLGVSVDGNPPRDGWHTMQVKLENNHYLASSGLIGDSVSAVRVWASCSHDPPNGRHVRGVHCVLQCAMPPSFAPT
eukprot:8929529-Pyramimonas_sp.AAC.1